MANFDQLKKSAERFLTWQSCRENLLQSPGSLHRVSSAICLLVGIAMLTGCFSGNGSSRESDVMFFGRALIGPDRDNDEMMLHFIVQGNNIYLDQNKDDIPDPDELLTTNQLPPIVNPTSEVKYLVKEIRLGKSPQLVDEDFPQALGLTVEVEDKVVYSMGGSINMSVNPQTSDWVHFAGKLEFLFDPEDELFTVGSTAEIRVNVGTKAYGSAHDLGGEDDSSLPTNGSEEDVRISMMLPIDALIAPDVEIRIPTDSEMYTTKLNLGQACCGDTFGGALSIPDHVIPGQMEVTFRFDQWPGPPIEPLSVKVKLAAE